MSNIKVQKSIEIQNLNDKITFELWILDLICHLDFEI